jgi:hypothetical protein
MNEKIIEKVRKLLEITQANGASENEAMMAALKAQKLMAENGLDAVAIESSKEEEREISQECVDTRDKGHYVSKWKYRLATIISENFRCKVFAKGDNYIVFYGHKSDSKIAADVFKFLFQTGKKLATKHYNLCRKEGCPTKGVLNSYLIGFCQGIAEALNQQCVALMIVTPKDVEQTFAKMSFQGKPKTTQLNHSGDLRAYECGRMDGKSIANSRSLEGV